MGPEKAFARTSGRSVAAGRGRGLLARAGMLLAELGEEVVVLSGLFVLRAALHQLAIAEGGDGALLHLLADRITGLAGVLDLLEDLELAIVDLRPGRLLR